MGTDGKRFLRRLLSPGGGIGRAVATFLARLTRFEGGGYDLLRILLGLLLLAAAGLKAHQLVTEPPVEPGLLGSPWLLWTGVALELFLAAWLLSGLRPWVSRLAAMGSFAAFAGISLEKSLSGAATCGCFGTVSVHPWATVALDLIAVMGLWLLRPRGTVVARDVREAGAADRGDPGVTAVVAVSAFAVGLALGMLNAAMIARGAAWPGGEDLAMIEPRRWVGGPCPILPHVDIGPRLAQGRWSVLLYHHDCAKCRAVLGETEARDDRARGPRAQCVAAIELPPFARDGTDELPPGVIRGRLAPRERWFAATPVSFGLSDGVVVWARGH